MPQPPHVSPSNQRFRLQHLLKLRETQMVSLRILLLAALVGTLAGLVGALFQRGTAWIFSARPAFITQHLSGSWLLIPALFALSALLAMLAYYLVHRFAPETSGSGVPEIEGAVQDLRPTRWRRVLPVKFIGGLGSLGSGLVLGREGPTIQMGANLGQMITEKFKVHDGDSRHILLLAGAAGGLAAAFNAPLAGILFVIEEMRPQFKYNLISIKAVVLGSVCATIMMRLLNGQAAILQVGQFSTAPLKTLWLYLVLGLCIGVAGIAFNRCLLFLQDVFQRFYQGKCLRFVLTGGLLGGVFGVVGLYMPAIVGEGYDVIHQTMAGGVALPMLALFFVLRFFTSTLSFSSRAPGGIFSPLLALGTLFGGAFGYVALDWFPGYGLEVGAFGIAGMGALFAATVRAPITGILLVLEMTDNYQLILPMIITCLGATIVAQYLGGRPLYTVLLEKTLAASARDKAAETGASA
ncbi:MULTISPECIES: H(+)/Cl(-) exchange transporter ClcA [Pseudomonadota]|uniref:H(+)/Cl(-) exchange transporter ClcA n=1 Tax=Pseudomonadota TaxID=1224 RepID=UPI002AFE1474|nr:MULTISPECIES: H(+)/Cl(-) exchange transporter ClcA [Pseudomonadota]